LQPGAHLGSVREQHDFKMVTYNFFFSLAAIWVQGRAEGGKGVAEAGGEEGGRAQQQSAGRTHRHANIFSTKSGVLGYWG
jgi:hypothetical protein